MNLLEEIRNYFTYRKCNYLFYLESLPEKYSGIVLRTEQNFGVAFEIDDDVTVSERFNKTRFYTNRLRTDKSERNYLILSSSFSDGWFVLDGSVSTSDSFANQVAEDPAQYVIHGTKVIDLSKVDVEELRKEIKVAQYKAIEIDDLKDYIEQILQQMLNKNITRTQLPRSLGREPRI